MRSKTDMADGLSQSDGTSTGLLPVLDFDMDHIKHIDGMLERMAPFCAVPDEFMAPLVSQEWDVDGVHQRIGCKVLPSFLSLVLFYPVFTLPCRVAGDAALQALWAGPPPDSWRLCVLVHASSGRAVGAGCLHPPRTLPLHAPHARFPDSAGSVPRRSREARGRGESDARASAGPSHAVCLKLQVAEFSSGGRTRAA